MSSKNQLYTSKVIFRDQHSILTGDLVGEFITLTLLTLDDPNKIYFSSFQLNDIQQQQFRDPQKLFKHLKPQNTLIDLEKKSILASDLNQKIIFKCLFKQKQSFDVFDKMIIMEAKFNKKIDERFLKIEENFKKQPTQKNQVNNQATNLILKYFSMPVMLILMHIFVTYYYFQPIQICEIQSSLKGELKKSFIKILIGLLSFSFIFYYLKHCLSQKQKMQTQNQKIQKQVRGKKFQYLILLISITILICVIPYHIYMPKLIDFSSPTANDVCQYIVNLSNFQQMDVGEKLKKKKIYQTQNKKIILKKLFQKEDQDHQNILNIIVGFPGVGKTSSILQFMKNRINYKKTIVLYFNFENIEQEQIQNYDFIFPLNENEIKVNNFQIQFNILEILGLKYKNIWNRSSKLHFQRVVHHLSIKHKIKIIIFLDQINKMLKYRYIKKFINEIKQLMNSYKNFRVILLSTEPFLIGSAFSQRIHQINVKRNTKKQIIQFVDHKICLQIQKEKNQKQKESLSRLKFLIVQNSYSFRQAKYLFDSCKDNQKSKLCIQKIIKAEGRELWNVMKKMNSQERTYFCKAKFIWLQEETIKILTNLNIIYNQRMWYSKIRKEAAKRVCYQFQKNRIRGKDQ